MVREVAMAYLQHGTPDSMYRRLLIVLTFLCCGRAGEAGTATWNLTQWNFILQCIHFEWSQLKTSKQKGVSLVSDFEDYNMDIYHCLGCYFIATFGQYNGKDEQNWLFPDLAKLERGGASKRIRNNLKDLTRDSQNVEYVARRVASLPGDVSGTSLRIGAINECAARNVPPYAVIAIGGHSDGHPFEYYGQKLLFYRSYREYSECLIFQI